MTDVKLESMDDSHIGQILEIEKTLFPTPWTQGMFEQETIAERGKEGPGSYAVVAMSGRRVVGYAVAWFVEGGVHLMNIAVRKEFQRRGVGKLLMKHLIDTATAAAKLVVILEVRSSNTAAQALYREFMFESFSIRRNYYADTREDAVLMALDLAAPVKRRKREARKRKPD